jgi:hypothetical protein
MPIKHKNHTDFYQFELRNAVIETQAGDPLDAVAGQMYYNTTDYTLRIYDGTQWAAVAYGNIDWTITGNWDFTQPVVGVDFIYDSTSESIPGSGYDGWDIYIDSSFAETIGSSDILNFSGGNGIEITYNEITNTLTFDGEGAYTLPIASVTVLGGVKVGNNLSITEDGTLSAVLPDLTPYTKRDVAETISAQWTFEQTITATGGINTESGTILTKDIKGNDYVNIRSGSNVIWAYFADSGSYIGSQTNPIPNIYAGEFSGGGANITDVSPLSTLVSDDVEYSLIGTLSSGTNSQTPLFTQVGITFNPSLKRIIANDFVYDTDSESVQGGSGSSSFFLDIDGTNYQTVGINDTLAFRGGDNIQVTYNTSNEVEISSDLQGAIFVDDSVNTAQELVVGRESMESDASNQYIGIVGLDGLYYKLRSYYADYSNSSAQLAGIDASNYARTNLSNETFSGSVTATTFYGDGSNLTNLAIPEITVTKEEVILESGQLSVTFAQDVTSVSVLTVFGDDVDSTKLIQDVDFTFSDNTITLAESYPENTKIQLENYTNILPTRSSESGSTILESPDGTKFRIKVDNSGNLSTEPI